MRLVDIQLCFPFTLLALFIAAVLGSSLGNVILIAGITSWVRYARLVRGEILGIKEMEYIEAIRAAGGTEPRTFSNISCPISSACHRYRPPWRWPRSY